MRTRGEKLLLAFLVFSITVFGLSMLYRGDSPTDRDGDVHISDSPAVAVEALPDTAEKVQGMNLLDRYNLKEEAPTRWKLDDCLREISGLAMTPDDRLLAHGDEQGIIYEIDYRNGSIVKSFALTNGTAPVKDDFEGIAVAEGRIYLVTSAGRVYECREGGDQETVPFSVYTTRVGRDSEIEGLAYEPNERALLLMTKMPRSESHKGILTLYKWSIDSRQLIEGAHIAWPIADLAQRIESKNFHPSGIERHPASGHYFIVAAQEKAVAEVTPKGEILAVTRLPAGLHRQAEGITFSNQQILILSDEGGQKRATLTLYPLSGGR